MARQLNHLVIVPVIYQSAIVCLRFFIDEDRCQTWAHHLVVLNVLIKVGGHVEWRADVTRHVIVLLVTTFVSFVRVFVRVRSLLTEGSSRAEVALFITLNVPLLHVGSRSRHLWARLLLSHLDILLLRVVIAALFWNFYELHSRTWSLKLNQ